MLNSSSPGLGASLRAHVTAWVRRHLVDVDPNPLPSRLDLLDRPASGATGRALPHRDRDRQPVEGYQDIAS
ncbi:hypothetical protein GCM10022197_15540 [Microlunatus spumicola]|uniref:Uncharacterized protein n=1 Tax=Microlunatus spumicola TaxID=81499 RepID=A0ABP6X7R4_9ACTN